MCSASRPKGTSQGEAVITQVVRNTFRRGGTHRSKNEKSTSYEVLFSFLVAGMGFEPHDLRVMSPTSYQTALPRDIVCQPDYYSIASTVCQPLFEKFHKVFFDRARRESHLSLRCAIDIRRRLCYHICIRHRERRCP